MRFGSITPLLLLLGCCGFSDTLEFLRRKTYPLLGSLRTKGWFPDWSLLAGRGTGLGALACNDGCDASLGVGAADPDELMDSSLCSGEDKYSEGRAPRDSELRAASN